MNSNIINVILIKKCYQKGTPMKDAASIAFDLKKLLTLGNSVSSVILLTLWVAEPQVQEIRAIGTVRLIGTHLLKLQTKFMQFRVKKR